MEVHFSLDVDGRNNSVPHKNKEYEILYRKILKDIQYEDTKRQKERKEKFLKMCIVLHQKILWLEQMCLDVFLISII